LKLLGGLYLNQVFAVKFGGTSLADAAQFERVTNIIRADGRRRYIIASAPGKRFDGDEKVTDILIQCFNKRDDAAAFDALFAKAAERFISIRDGLKLKTDIEAQLDIIRKNISKGAGYDYLASRGEYLNGLLLADLLNAEFVDASELIFFTESGSLDSKKTYRKINTRLSGDGVYVIPGFYGVLPDGTVKTFPRGGSDITGSVIARGAQVCLYENWTDVSGIKMADPRIIPEALTIKSITYRELRELSYMGANVLHEEAVFPVREMGIPINVKNTNMPDEPGTMITENGSDPSKHTITGLAGRMDFTVILLDKALMNNEIGFARKLLSIFERHRIPVEHMPTGIDSISVVVDSSYLPDSKLEIILEEIKKELEPDTVGVVRDIALIAIVGRGMQNRFGTSGEIMMELGRAGININLLNQSINEMSIIIGVHNRDCHRTLRVIYELFVGDGGSGAE
jgi:aspartate kinase